MQYINYFGIDVSKEKLDICLWTEGKVVQSFIIKNQEKDICSFVNKIVKNGNFDKSLWTMEHTGVYIHILIRVLLKFNASVWVENPMQIKQSQGITRIKNDKIDAARIAEYAYTFRHKVNIYKPKRPILLQLQRLVNLREQLMQTRIGIKKSIDDAKRFLDKQTAIAIVKTSKKTMTALVKDMKEVEGLILNLVKSDENLNRLFKIITSVQGIGTLTAIAIIITTNEFTLFKNHKKYACYCGIAPFQQQSGKSLKLKPRVSQKANKDVKKLLHMSALTTLKIKNSEFALYYQRKKDQGKNGMTILNAIRAKLVARIFSCVQQERMYKIDYHFEST